MKQHKVLLGIESSCDDTSAAIAIDGHIQSNVIASQDVHKRYGGVVPELASRAHQKNIVPVVDEALQQARVDRSDIDAIAYTHGPGLLGSLLVGASFAKGMSLALDIPLVEVNHLHAHVLSLFCGDVPHPSFPFLCLTVSGGHTQIMEVSSYLELKTIGKTIDDAAGEAFDKAAKIMSLPYPGGPVIDTYAQKGNGNTFKFAKPKVPGLDFSFSGLKTSILYFLQDAVKHDKNFVKKHLYDLCASIQKCIVDILMERLKEAAQQTGITTIGIAGGVSANRGLRNELRHYSKELGWQVFIPQLKFCTDNAAMIALCGHHKFIAGETAGAESHPMARLPVI